MRLSPAARKRAAQRRRERLAESGREAWQERHSGRCAVCGAKGPLVRHHVVTERRVREFGGNPWDRRNALEVGAPRAFGGKCTCHDGHHHPGVNDTRIPLDKVPPAAIEFARELMGDGPADIYLARSYAP